MAPQHGITTNTTKRFTIDAGAAYTGFTSFTVPGTLMGATRGGSTVTIEQEIKEMPVDGAHGPMKGARRIITSKASMTVNFIEHTLDNFKRALVGSDSAVYTVSWDEITRDMVIAAADYLADVTLVGEVSGSVNAMAIKLANVIADGNFEMSFADKEEGVLAVTFTAHFDPALLGAADYTEPWTLYWPKEA